ncbi:tRNA (guanosine(46)-N7)-methyltransferase TrmB [bacterium]|nr:tRNA (guanosine(46)-N7)-methyltransferase TrmB [bacterium]
MNNMIYLNDLIAPEFSLSKGLDVPEDLRKLVDWEKVYGNSLPLTVEIGFGNAEFLADLAIRNPEYNILGIELSPISIRKANRLIERHNLKNVRLFKLDARLVMKYFVPDDFIETFYINFPDPWPKKKHKKNRLISEQTLDVLLRKLKKGGQLFFVTDWKDYAEEAREVFAEKKELKSIFYPEWYKNEYPEYFSTKYERKWKNMDRDIYYQCYLYE